jgi:uncharacterized membrane protein YbhN (UPF0104 family)
MIRRSEESRSVAREQRAGLFRPSRGIVVGAVIGFPASVALLLLSLRHLDTGALRASLRAADPWTLALAVCTVSVVYPIQAARWRLISMASPRLPLRRFVEWVLGAIAINNVVPGRPGDLLRVEWLSRGARMPRTPALASVAVDRGLDVVALVVALALTYPVMQHALWLDRLEIVAGLVGLLVVMLLVAALVYARRSRVSPAGRVRRLFANAGREAGNRLHGWRGVGAVLLTVLGWGAWALSAWLVASALGIALTPGETVFVTSVLNLGVAVPSSPGYIGTYQWLGVSALGLLGVNHTEAFAFSVLMHASWFIPTTLAGVVLALRKLTPAVGSVPSRDGVRTGAFR